MRALAVLLAVTACTLAVTGCTPEPPRPPMRPPAAAPDAGPSPANGGGAPGGPASRAAAPGPDAAGVAPLPILSAEVISGTSAAPLARDGPTVVPGAARFRVEVAARLVDGRLCLLDAADGMVAADGEREVGATTRFTLAPTSPLRAGSGYRLRLEGAEGPLLHGADGRAYHPATLAIRAAGDPPPRGRGRRRR